MKNVTAKLVGIAKFDCRNRITATREYPIFKISHRDGQEMVTIITDNGELVTMGAFHFIFKAE